MSRRIAASALAVVLCVAASANAKKQKAQAPEPPALPPATDPASLYSALDDAQRRAVDADLKVVTFAEVERPGNGVIELVAFSIGTLPASPDAVRSLLARLSDYPSWLALQPSYKKVRVQGASQLVAEIGSADAPRPKRTMIYEVSSAEGVTTWRVLESGTSLKPGSSLTFEVAPHPTMAGASLVSHRQVGILPPEGRMTAYLSDDDDKGQNRWWKDSSRHARRLHLAFDAALRHPPGAEREGLYVESFQREFGGKLPWWAGR